MVRAGLCGLLEESIRVPRRPIVCFAEEMEHISFSGDLGNVGWLRTLYYKYVQ